MSSITGTFGNFGAPNSPPCHRIKLCTRTVDFEHALQARADGLRVLRDLLAILAMEPRDFLEHVCKGRLAELRLWRKVGAAPIRFAVRRQEHGQRPAALLAHHVQRRLEDGVEVRTFLAVDLHVHIEIVHQRRRRRVLEALVRHHVAPVAGCVSDGNQSLCWSRYGLVDWASLFMGVRGSLKWVRAWVKSCAASGWHTR
jgi:hypothetical protein